MPTRLAPSIVDDVLRRLRGHYRAVVAQSNRLRITQYGCGPDAPSVSPSNGHIRRGAHTDVDHHPWPRAHRGSPRGRRPHRLSRPLRRRRGRIEMPAGRDTAASTRSDSRPKSAADPDPPRALRRKVEGDTPAETRTAGRTIRQEVSRSAAGDWGPASDRPDPESRTSCPSAMPTGVRLDGIGRGGGGFGVISSVPRCSCERARYPDCHSRRHHRAVRERGLPRPPRC